MYKNATLRKVVGKKLFDAFHLYYAELKIVWNIQQLKYFDYLFY